MTPQELLEAVEELREQRDLAVEEELNDVSSMLAEISDTALDVDDDLIDFHFLAVEESIRGSAQRLRGIDLDQVRALAAITLPGDPLRAETPLTPVGRSWTLRSTLMDLAHDDDDPGRSEIEQRLLQARGRICELLVSAQEVWRNIEADVRRPDPRVTESALHTIAENLEGAHQDWFDCAGELYQHAPGALGHTGDLVSSAFAGMRAR